MKNRKHNVGDVIKVHTFAGVDVYVELLEYIEVPTKKRWEGYCGWRTKLVNEEDVKNLQNAGVPITLEDESWIYDWQIVKKFGFLDRAIEDCEPEYEEEIDLYKVYGGD